MRITTRLVLDWDGNVLEHEWSEYDGPVALAKGGGANAAAQNLQKTTMNNANAMFNTGMNLQNSELIPFATAEMTNPTGLGAQTMSQMQTLGGETAGGVTGAATKTAMDEAARTGNFGAIPSIIQGTAKQAGATQSTNALDTAIKNREVQLQQSQQGAGLLGGISSGDISGSTGMYGESSNGINDMINAEKLMQASTMQDIGEAANIGSSIAGMFP